MVSHRSLLSNGCRLDFPLLWPWQDSSFASVTRYKGFLEVINSDWMEDGLSDDGEGGW